MIVSYSVTVYVSVLPSNILALLASDNVAKMKNTAQQQHPVTDVTFIVQLVYALQRTIHPHSLACDDD